MVVYETQCVSSIPLLSADRDYSDRSAPVSLDLSYAMIDVSGDLVEPVIVPAGSGAAPYSPSSVVTKNCSVNLYDFFVSGKNGATAQYVTFSLYLGTYGGATKSYIFSKRLYLSANEVFEISFDRIENLSLGPGVGLNQVYLERNCSEFCSCNVYCNVVVDD